MTLKTIPTPDFPRAYIKRGSSAMFPQYSNLEDAARDTVQYDKHTSAHQIQCWITPLFYHGAELSGRHPRQRDKAPSFS